MSDSDISSEGPPPGEGASDPTADAAPPADSQGAATASDESSGAGTADGSGPSGPPAFDASATGLRRLGAQGGGPKLLAAAGDVIEVYWSVKNADLVRITRDDKPIGQPDRATDGACPLWLSGLGPGDYQFKLAAGLARPGSPVWADDAAVALTLTLTAPMAVTKFWGDPEPDDDGKDHLPQALQLAHGTKVKLQFEAVGAKQVQISAASGGGSGAGEPLDPVDLDGDGKGNLVVDPQDQPTLYSAVAKSSELSSAPAGPVSVEFHAPEDLVSPIATMSGASGQLSLLGADGQNPGDGGLRLGAGDGLQIKWAVTGAKKARLTSTPLASKPAPQADAPASAAHVSDDQLRAGVELPISDQGFGSGVTVVDPGPGGSTQYALLVTGEGATDETTVAQATAYVANFNVQLKLKGDQPAANRSCVLSIAGQQPITGTTNELGELWLWIPNIGGYATLKILDGSTEVASWIIILGIEPGVARGTPTPSGPDADQGATT